MELWVWITLFAAVMQTVRTGWQKALISEIGDFAVTYIRFALALPLAPLYLYILSTTGMTLPQPNPTFYAYTAAAAVTQITATFMLVKLFSRANFAVCTAYTKTEATQIALFGALLFSLPMSLGGGIGVAIGAVGIMLMLPSPKSFNKQAAITAAVGVGCGGIFALTALFAKEAAHTLDAEPLPSAALTLSVMLLIQTITLSIMWAHKIPFAKLWKVRKPAMAVGLFSFAGSIGWLTAFTLTHPAYVKTLAQIELPMAYLLGRAAFREKPSTAEIVGMCACAIAAIQIALFG